MMKQNVAPTGLSIKIITSLILVLTGGMLIGAIFKPGLLWGGIILAIIVLFCYLSAPIAYELNGIHLTVISRINKKVFGPIRKGSFVDNEKPSFGLRLWGNGGLFAGTGIFWNKKYGIFRAYISTGVRSNLILIETSATKIIISPEKPEEFIACANSSDTGKAL
jgi:hypothetical protein